MALLFVLNLVLTLLGWAFELSPFTDNRSRRRGSRSKSAASSRTSRGPVGVNVGYDLPS